jgi:hypothetical protein
MNRDELTGVAELHAGKRRGLVIVLGNVLLLVVMLGLPWLRGYFRTRELWSAFARYGACICGGKPHEQPGLGIPQGHDAHFATRALREPGFSAGCEDELTALAPEEAIFIMPAVKTAEADLRAAVKLVRAELAPLAARSPGARLSTRPLRAIERLRAGLANHALATGIAAVPEGEAFSLSTGPVLPTPARLPLYAGVNAAVSLWGSDVELHALATDSTGISHVHLRAGRLEQTRAPRPKLLQAAVPRELPLNFIWATPEARCHEREDHCADKALGIARVQLPASALPVPRWLGAHPHGRIDRSLFRAASRIVVAAQSSDGAAELREFELSEEAEASASPEMPPLPPTQTWSVRQGGPTLVLSVGNEPKVLGVSSNESALLLQQLTSGGAEPLAQLAAKPAPWLVGCTEGQGFGFAFGHESALAVGARSSDGLVTTWEPVALALRDAIHEREPARDRVVRMCGVARGAVVVALDRSDRLAVVRCALGERTCTVEPIASSVRSFAAVTHGEHLTIAYAGDGEASQVRVRTAPFAAADRGDEQVPAVCWSDSRGLCGAPLLAHVGGRLLLGAREATDLMLLESADSGATWRPLKGLGRRD